MNRLQKKCVIVSAGLHALLIGILLFGSAFFNSEPKDQPHPLLTAFDPSMINDLLTKGGNPNVTVVPPSAVQRQNHPMEAPKAPERPRVRQVVNEEPEPPVKKKFSDDAPPKPRRKDTLTPDELKLAKPRTTKPRKQKPQPDSTSKESDDTAQREAQQFARSIRSLSKEFSTSTAVTLPGPGDGGPLSAAYRDIVASTYNSAWSSPPDLSDDSAKDIVSVTIARDGRVINGRIVKPSGNPAMDRSIQNMLDTVTVIQPFPEGSKETERTFEIVLSLRTKR